jgi:hypothetical protein
MRGAEFERALEDPAGAFHSPEEIVTHHALTLEQKRRLLEAWRRDEEALAGHDPNATPDDASLLRRVARALANLDVRTGESRPAARD